MRVLVTGANGYVSAAVSKALSARGHQVTAWLRPGDPAERAARAGLAVARGELTDTARLRELASSVDAVFHGVASQNPAFTPVNEAAIDALFAGLGRGGAFAMQGGSGVFGDTGERTFDGTEARYPPPPLAAQSALERRVLARSASGTRPYIVYGSLVYGGAGAMIPNLLVNAAKRAGAGQMIGAGENRWSTVHVDDWATLIALLLERSEASGGAYIASSGDISMSDLAASVASAIGARGKTVSLSFAEAEREWGFFAPLLAGNQRFTARRSMEAVDWHPVAPSLEQELERLAHS